MLSRLIGLNELIKAFDDLKVDADERIADKEFDRMLMRITVMLATPAYSCLRPPGAAGAMLVGTDRASSLSEVARGIPHVVLGCAEPPVGHTCKDRGECEIENGHCVRTIHAEVMALLTAARCGISTRDSKLFSILKPCYQCTKAIIAAGVRKVYYAGAAYNEQRTEDLIQKAGIEYIKLDIGLSYGQ